jgi:hypothetical protein
VWSTGNGIDGPLPEYMGHSSLTAMKQAFSQRRVTNLVGGNDVCNKYLNEQFACTEEEVGECYGSEDTAEGASCAAMLQGTCRMMREFAAFQHYHEVGDDFSSHSIVALPGVTHDGCAALQSPTAGEAMFGEATRRAKARSDAPNAPWTRGAKPSSWRNGARDGKPRGKPLFRPSNRKASPANAPAKSEPGKRMPPPRERVPQPLSSSRQPLSHQPAAGSPHLTHRGGQGTPSHRSTAPTPLSSSRRPFSERPDTQNEEAAFWTLQPAPSE